jgi:hypothetical protein
MPRWIATVSLVPVPAIVPFPTAPNHLTLYSPSAGATRTQAPLAPVVTAAGGTYTPCPGSLVTPVDRFAVLYRNQPSRPASPR